jgi:hypothetical protein
MDQAVAKTPEQLLALRIGGATVAENLQRAVESGQVIRHEDGTFELPAQPRADNWKTVDYGPPLGCKFLIRFLFRQAYAESAVPLGCSACYKVKVVPRTLRELVAAWEIGKRIECQSKWGVDLGNPYSQNIYAGYFYTTGLDGARVIFKIVREAIDADAKLGPGVAMTIKRGCSEYEAKLGPSDRYEFAPELAELESYLRSRLRKSQVASPPTLPVAHWIDTAYRIGDDTYLDFTGGKRLRPKTVTYDP